MALALVGEWKPTTNECVTTHASASPDHPLVTWILNTTGSPQRRCVLPSAAQTTFSLFVAIGNAALKLKHCGD